MEKIWIDLIIYGIILLIATVGGHYFSIEILKKFKRQMTENDEGLMDAGKVIGYLERILIVFSAMIGEYSLIGFMITAKSIVRFEEFTDRKFAEYYLIGTFVSISFALLTVLLSFMILNYFDVALISLV